MSRIVVKVGSNILTRPDGNPDITNMSALVDQIAALHALGHQIILVSSGAVACGRGSVKPHNRLDAVAERQLFSAVGQIRLINLYARLFESYGLTIGQVLTQKENFSSRQAYLNQRACMLTMLDCGVIPVVNENDTVSLTELMFTDNDELSGMVATMTDADMLIILSNVDGIYTGDPTDAQSRLISTITPDDTPETYISSAKSGYGRGGMSTKCSIARKVADEGIAVVIARGNRPRVLVDLITGPSSVPHTLFAPASRQLSNIKRWIAHSDSFAKGSVIINDRAAAAITGSHAVSLLPLGVTDIQGEWAAGDIICIIDSKGTRIAIGRASYDSSETQQYIGRHDMPPLVHYDYLYIENTVSPTDND